MSHQPSNADISKEPMPAAAGVMPGRPLGIRFYPAVEFAVSCKPAKAVATDVARTGGRQAIKATCRPVANGRHGMPASSCNVRVTGRS